MTQTPSKMSKLSKPPFIFHFRRSKNGYEWQNTNATPKGGLTVVCDPESNTAAIARCSNKDRFQKRIGVNIALGRLKLYLKSADSQPDWMNGFEGRAVKTNKRSIAFRHIKHYLENVLPIKSFEWNGIVRFGTFNIASRKIEEIREHAIAIAKFTARYYHMDRPQKSTDVSLPIYKKPVLTEIHVEKV